MNTQNLNKVSASYNQDTAPSSSSESQRPQQRVSAHATLESPKKTKKAKDAFRTISEVADKLGVQQHVLRFWETKFSQVRPLKRGGGRRYYRPEDVALLQRIHHLLYTEGYTIKGVQKLLREQGKAQIIAQGSNENNAPVASAPKVQPQQAEQPAQPAPQQQQPETVARGLSSQQRVVLEVLLAELKAMRALIKV
jgi:DNA-binding transcriptional MerR regulator